MFEKCDSCTKPSEECIPRVLSMSAHDQREWCKKWKERLGWTKKEIAEKSKIPEGTLSGIFGKSETREPRPYTMHAIIGALTGCSVEEIYSCRSEIEREVAKNQAQDYERLSCECTYYQEEIKRLEQSCAEQLGKIHGLEEVVRQLDVEKRILDTKIAAAEKVEKNQEETIRRLENNSKGKNWYGFFAGIISIIPSLLLWAYVRYDTNNLDVGFIRDPLMVPLAITFSGIFLAASVVTIVIFILMLRNGRNRKTAEIKQRLS